MKILKIIFRQQVREAKKPKGTSLLEIVVTLGLFLVVISAMLQVFVQTLQAERRAFATQAALDNTRYTLEVMARSIRQLDPNASAFQALSCTATSPCGSLTFHHQDVTRDNPQTAAGVMSYGLSTVNGVGSIAETSGSTNGNTLPITSGNTVTVTRLSFVVVGNGALDLQQPRVVIMAKISSPSNPGVVADVQTTVDIRTLQE